MTRTLSLSPKKLVRRLAPGAVALASHRPWLSNLRLPGTGRRALSEPLGRLGSLEVRQARGLAELRAAQRLRYRIFYEQMSAIADARTAATGRDFDEFDPICDHLVVVDHAVRTAHFGREKPSIVGTYRLLRQDIAELNDGFYTAGEYDLAPLLEAHSHRRFLELGRSCVLAPYRNKRTLELLWSGIWSYVLAHNIDVMIGCASLGGTDPERNAMALSFLHHYCAAPAQWQVRALAERYVPMDRMARAQVDPRAAMRELPPLVKGYLRLGAFVGDGAVVDHQFGTTDVIIVLPVDKINRRYINHYGADASRYAS